MLFERTKLTCTHITMLAGRLGGVPLEKNGRQPEKN